MQKALIAVACAASLLVPVTAQAGEVHSREVRQQHRIYDGVQDGQLTQREYATLERQEYRLNQQRRNDLHDGDGRDGLTRGQYYRLNRDENHLSHEIHRDNHNDRRPH